MNVRISFEQKSVAFVLAAAAILALVVISQPGSQPDSLAAIRGTENSGFSRDDATLPNSKISGFLPHRSRSDGSKPGRLVKLQQDGELDYKLYLPLVWACHSEPITYYVSKTGNNSDGRSWVTAWNELDQINWDVIQPGDTILLDGGSTKMVYTSTLSVGKSGTPARPINITLASEPGRDGRVVIFGGRSTPLPYCGQEGYVIQADGVRNTGILLDQKSWVVIDGRKWRGIVIHGHNKRGIRLYRKWGSPDYPLSTNIIFRNLEIYDNGYGYENGGAWNPDGMGVSLTGRHITFERVIIHDNGQDALQSGGIIEDITLRRVWLYNQRPHPIKTDDVWNYCTHSDGVQIFNGGNQYGLVVEDSIIGPGFMQGLLLGAFGNETTVATIHDVTISNTLIVGHHGESGNAGLLTQYDADGEYPNDPPMNYEINRVTVARDVGQSWWSMLIFGSGHTVVDSVFSGGLNLLVDGEPVAGNNYWWQLTDHSGIGIEADPMFVDDDFASVGDGFADFNFETQNPALSGAGSSITSPDDLLGN